MDKQNYTRLRPMLALCARRTRRRTTDWCGRPPVRAATDEVERNRSDEHLNIRRLEGLEEALEVTSLC